MSNLKLIFPSKPVQSDQLKESKEQEPKEQNQKNIPQLQNNSTNTQSEVQNDQPYLIPPNSPQEQNNNNIQNEQNQNLLEHELISQTPSKKRLKRQCDLAVSIFFSLILNVFFFLFHLYPDLKKKEKLALTIILGITLVLMFILGILMVIKTADRETTRNKSIFILSLITTVFNIGFKCCINNCKSRNSDNHADDSKQTTA